MQANQRTAVRSGHSLGKDYTAAIILLVFLSTHVPSVVITTGPTDRQIETIIWGYIRKIHREAKVPVGGEVLTKKIKIEGREDWYALGFKSKDYDPESFGGFHAPNVMVIVTEASGVEPVVYDALEGLLTGNSKLLLVGNPLRSEGRFYDAFRYPGYQKLGISCYESPNVIEKKIVFPGLVDYEWVKDKEERWGTDNPLFQARVLGQFPSEGPDTPISLTAVEASIGREVEPQGSIIIGLDVARFGLSRTVFTIRQGMKVLGQYSYQGSDLMRTVGEAIRLIKQFNAQVICVDDSGLGGGVSDRLREQNYNVVPVNFGATALDSEHFANRGTELFWAIRENIGSLSLPDSDELRSQLPARRCKPNSRGQLKLESKEELSKRGLASPDEGDSLALTFAWGAGQIVSATIEPEEKERPWGILGGLR